MLPVHILVSELVRGRRGDRGNRSLRTELLESEETGAMGRVIEGVRLFERWLDSLQLRKVVFLTVVA